MQCSRILVVSGASGAGKTTIVRMLSERGVPGVSFHHFDSVGVPSDAGPEWQVATLRWWIERLADADGLAVLEGSVRLSAVRDAFAEFHVDGHLVLVDCARTVREDRLRERPELITQDMANWAAYLREQADALGVRVIDTTSMSIDEATGTLHAHVAALSAV